MSEWRQLYSQYEQQPLLNETHAAERVNALYEPAMRNDKAAANEVVSIILNCTHKMAASKLQTKGLFTADNLEELMQDTAQAVLEVIHRGYNSKANEEGFFGYLIVTAGNRVKNYIAKASKQRANEQSADGEEFQKIKSVKGDVDGKVDMEWGEYISRKIMEHYVTVLKNNHFPPYRILVYCYASIIPKMFRESKNISFLKKMDEIYKRNKEVRSWYDEESNSVKGEVRRDSEYLVKWAVAAMQDCTIDILNKEFISFYNMEPLLTGDSHFVWGNEFREKLDGVYEKAGIPMKDVVITSQFTKSAISNYAQRVGAAFLADVQEAIIEDSEIMELPTELLFDLLKKNRKHGSEGRR